MTESYIASVRTALADYFSEKADYRRDLAEDDDIPWAAGKNESYAESTDLFVNYIRSLPDDDPTLQMLAGCPDLFSPGGDVFMGPEVDFGETSLTDQMAIHIGPRGSVMDPSECADEFRAFAETAIEEWQDRQEENEEDLVEDEEDLEEEAS